MCNCDKCSNGLDPTLCDDLDRPVEQYYQENDYYDELCDEQDYEDPFVDIDDKWLDKICDEAKLDVAEPQVVEKDVARMNIYGDGIGYVKLLDSMGDEFTPSEDARTSTGKGRLGPEKDAALQARLIKDAHTSPFEGVVLKFEMMVPLFVLREIDRHRTVEKTADGDVELTLPEENGRKWFSRNEMSGRYVQMPNSYYVPGELRYQDKNNNQGGSSQPLAAFDRELYNSFIDRGAKIIADARDLYDWAVRNNIERGMARIFNTQNQYTKIRLTGSLKNWLDFLQLRLPEGVVLHECRQVALAVESIIAEKFPSVYGTWRDEVYDTVRLTRSEVRQIARLLRMYDAGDKEFVESLANIGKKIGGK